MSESENSSIDAGSDHDESTVSGLEEVFELLKPFVSVKSEDNYAKLHEILETLGVSNMSHVEVLEEKDLIDVIKIADFRLMKLQIKQNTLGQKSKNDNVKSYSLVLENIISQSLCQQIKKDDEMLTTSQRAKVVKAVADDIRENYDPVRKSHVLKVASKLVNAYPTSFGCIIKDAADKAECSISLKNSIYNHVRYIQAENNRKSKSSADGGSATKVRKFTKSQNYGLNGERDLPNELQEGETPETQEAKRKLMVQMDSSGEPVNVTSVRKLMMETYCSQRKDIHARLVMEKLLERWPFIGKHTVLQNHFEFLMAMDLQAVFQKAADFFTKLEQFFKAETNRKRKGNSASIPSSLKELLLAYESGSKADACHKITMILCCMVYMKVPLEAVFIKFPENSSFDEVQASESLPDAGHPMIALLGNDPQINPRAYVVCEKRCISEDQISCSKAINVWFMAHFVFKYSYNHAAAPILEFIQRKFYGIIEEGTRRERKKTAKGYHSAPPEMTGPYLALMRALKEYCSTWNIDLEQ